MSLTPRLGPGARISIVLGLVFPAMIASALALAYYAWRDVEDVSSALEAQVRKTAAVQARDAIEGIERRLNEETHAFFARVTAVLEEPTEGDKCRVELPPIVDVFVLYEDTPEKNDWDCRAPASKKGLKGGDGLKEELASQRKWFDWKKIEPRAPKYVHGSVARGEGAVLFVLAVLRGADARLYHLVARLNLDYLRNQVVDVGLQRLAESYRVALIDVNGRPVAGLTFGTEPRREERFLYEQTFGSALWAWRLRLSPREVDIETQQAQMERQRLMRLLLIALSTSIIGVGLGIVLLAVMSERRSSHAKSDFIANVSHELKTPLSLIRMFGEMVATGRHKGEAAAREYGGIITRESERLTHLIDNVLDFARLERGKTSYKFQEADIAALLERAVDVCRYRVDREKMKLSIEVEPNLPPVRIDEDAVTLVILNLVDNATKYAAEGGQVIVSLRRSPGGVVLGVQDFGPGVPKAEHGRIFERFYRAENARQRNVRGSGIGLSLVEHIAHAHGGRVTVESPAPRDGATTPGAIFRVYFPAPVAIADTPAVPPAPPVSG